MEGDQFGFGERGITVVENGKIKGRREVVICYSFYKVKQVLLRVCYRKSQG